MFSVNTFSNKLHKNNIGPYLYIFFDSEFEYFSDDQFFSITTVTLLNVIIFKQR